MNRECVAFVVRRMALGSFAGLALRCLWCIAPSIWTCLVFWAHFYSLPWLPSAEPSQVKSDDAVTPPRWKLVVVAVGVLMVVVGITGNAVVTITNGGFMPVAGKLAAVSVWVQSTEAHRLRWLGDNYAGFSIGDLVAIAGFALAAVTSRSEPDAKKESPIALPFGTRGIRVWCGAYAFFLSPQAHAMPVVVGVSLALAVVAYAFTLVTEWRVRRRLEMERHWVGTWQVVVRMNGDPIWADTTTR